MKYNNDIGSIDFTVSAKLPCLATLTLKRKAKLILCMYFRKEGLKLIYFIFGIVRHQKYILYLRVEGGGLDQSFTGSASKTSKTGVR